METETASENDATLEHLRLRAEDRVLEVGFGPGRAIERVAQVVTRGAVSGADISEEMLRRASRRCARFISQGRVDLRLAAAERLPFEGASFDKAFSVHTLYFWARPLAVLAEIRRVLRPGGLLAVCFRESGEPGTADFPSAVYRFYTNDEVRSLLRDAGFCDVALSETGPTRGLRIATARVE